MQRLVCSKRTWLTTSVSLASAVVIGCSASGESHFSGGLVGPAPAPTGAAPASSSGGSGGMAVPTATTPLPMGGAPSSVPTSTGTPPAENPPPAMPPDTDGTDSEWCSVKAIIDKNCLGCHTTPPAGGAPFPLTTYDEVTAPHPTKAGSKIYERIGVRVHADKAQAEGLGVMPPGKPLAAADLALIDAWVAAGAPAGDDSTCGGSSGETPPPTEEEWPLKECDAVYKIVAHGSGGIDTPAMAPAGQESHPQVAWDAPWGDEEVQAIAFRSITDNRTILHHWILNGKPGGFLTGWAPGEDGIKKMREDVGMMMPSGKDSLSLDMHYFNTTGTTAQPDNSGVEICVVKQEHFRPIHAAVTMSLTSLLFAIPPNSKYQTTATCTVSSSEPITLLSASPHAHKLAVRMVFTVDKANGENTVMHDMPFVFGEQKSYALDPPVVVQKGDVINTTCYYENTTSSTVTFGESTTNEMCFNFALYYPAGALKCASVLGF
jgi:hypothetical protein